MEVVRHRALRPAVDQKCHRILLVRIEIRRFDDVAMDGFAVPALERELLGLAHLDALQRCGVEIGELDLLAAIRRRIKLGRCQDVVLCEDDPVWARVERADMAAAG